MTNVIHAHTLMDFIQANPHLTAIDEIKSEFIRQFGDVQFTNCTKNVYSFDEIVDFLFSRNKVKNSPIGIEVNEENRCHD